VSFWIWIFFKKEIYAIFFSDTLFPLLHTAHFYIEYAEYRMALIDSPTWGKNPERLDSAKRQLSRAFYANIVLGIAVFLSSSVLINRLTYEMDRRAADVLTGASRLFAGWIFMLLSYNLPQWMGVYSSVTDTYKTKVGLMRTTREIRFSFSWTLWRHLITMFFFNLYFSCRTYDFTTLYGALCGILVGIFLMVVVWAASTKFKNRKQTWAGVSAICMIIVSIVCVIIGTVYIEDVWVEDYQRGEYAYGIVNYPGMIFGLWMVFLLVIHIVAICLANRRHKNGSTNNRFTSQIFRQTLPGVKFNRTKTKSNVEDDSNVESAWDTNEEKEQAAVIDAETEEKRATGDDSDNLDDDDFVTNILSSVQPETGSARALIVDSADGPSFGYLLRVKLWETYGCCCLCCPCCCRDVKEDHNLCQETHMQPADAFEHKNVAWQAFDGFKLFLWYCISAFFLYLTIVNCGATAQQNVVRANLQQAFEVLYPVDYHTGPMCGWNEPTKNGEIRSFDSLQEMYDAGFELIHCGYCGECSNWNDLSIQWTTRTYLAEITKACAQKSLFGDREDVKQCNMDPPVGFTEGCAECWTVDELCAKDNCFWIFLQSSLINAVSDYRVQLNDITSATCDEALCGPEFVPCSGATRRRMNIKSDIERPLYQQCIYQDADWKTIFNHP
jgi:hypothetical protein